MKDYFCYGYTYKYNNNNDYSAKAVTSVQDCILTFVSMKPLNIMNKLTSTSSTTMFMVQIF